MSYRHIFIYKTVLEKIRYEVKLKKHHETGGPLVGYISEDNALVVVDAGGPGPKAEHSFFSVLIDGANAQNFCNEIYDSSGGDYDYIGDWHRHMCFSLVPSKDDEIAMTKMANFKYCPVKNPITIIYRKFPEGFAIYTLSEAKTLKPSNYTIL